MLVRLYLEGNGGKRSVVAWSEAEGKEMPATINAATHTFDFMGNPGPKVVNGSYKNNKVIVGNDPVYIFCDLDLDLEKDKPAEKK